MAGVGVLLAGIFGLAVYNLLYLESERDTLRMALGLAVLTGLFVALYTTYDAMVSAPRRILLPSWRGFS